MVFGTSFFFGWTPILLQKDRDHPAAFSNRPSAEPEDAGTIIDESIPKATEWTLYILHPYTRTIAINYCDILGDIWGATQLHFPTDLVRRYWRILQNHLGLIKGPDIDKVQSKRRLNL